MSSLKRGSNGSQGSQEQLLEERRNLLVQLFCISHISELKSIENHERIGKEIQQFLEQHDLARGKPVDIGSLPKFRPRDPVNDKKLNRSKCPSPAETKRELKKRSKDSTPNSNDDHEMDSQPLPPSTNRPVSRIQSQQTTFQSFKQVPQPQGSKQPQQAQLQQQIPNNRSVSPTQKATAPSDKTSNVVVESRTAKKQIAYAEAQSKPSFSEKHSRDEQGENGTPQEMVKRQKIESTTTNSSVSTTRNESTIELPPNPYSHMIEMSQLHADPTPIQIKEPQPFIIDSILENLSTEERKTYCDNDINVKETVYMITKENVPTKLAKAMPIQEIKYVSQTLPLLRLIPQSQKALTTDLINTALNEGRITVVASRIEELRRLNLWSLRQPKKFIDPITANKPVTHANVLLEEAKWMREDFRESLNYKIAMCTEIAQSISDYWTYGKICCVKRKPISDTANKTEHVNSSHDIEVKIQTDGLENTDMQLSNSSQNGPGSNAKDDSAVNHPADPIVDNTEESAGVEDMEIEQQVQGEEPSIDISKLLKGTDPQDEIPTPSLPIVSAEEYLSKKTKPRFRAYVDISSLSTLGAAISKSVRVYEGLDEENLKSRKSLPFEPVSKAIAPVDDDHFMKLVEKQLIEEEPSLVPLSKRRGMFYGNRRSHYLRPPVAPSLRYLKFRTPTIWLPEDDQELVKNINQYAYNWDLISSQMSNRHKRMYVSNIERRTPWQCFERFVQLNEKFNIADMKGPRAHNAQVWLYEAHKLQQQQKRRISPLGVGSESIQRGHRRLRWASMFEAMRKCIKKRENAPRPNPSQPRKPLDVKNMSVPTPQEMSELKAQRDDALRRDMQIKRAAKQRMQMAQMQAGKLPLTAASSPNLPAISNGSSKELKNKSRQSTPQSAPPLGEKTKVTSQQLPPRNVKPSNEREIIEGYAKKILLQKPNFTPELALIAAENIYRNVTLPEQGRARSEAASSSNNRVSEIKNTSPTPQEILQRAQKHD